MESCLTTFKMIRHNTQIDITHCLKSVRTMLKDGNSDFSRLNVNDMFFET